MIRLAVFDDEFVVVEGVRAMIRKMELDYEIVGEAYDGLGALEVFRRVNPDVVMTDIRMPGMDGLKLIQRIKELQPNTIFVVISGYQEFEYARTALNLGVKGFIDKPITMEKLRSIFSEVKEAYLTKRLSLNNQRYNEDLQALTESTTELVRKNQHEGLVEKIIEIQDLHRKMNPSLETFKLESYKFICIILGVFYEGHAAHEIDKHFPSFSNLELTHSFEEVNTYILTIINRIIEKMMILDTGSHHQTIIRILDYINQNYDKDFGLNEMADMVRMNPNYLSNLFKEEVGISFVKYLTKLRIDKAKELLLEGEKVNTVSHQVGFNNYRYFSEIFKRYEGRTPSEYKGQRR